MYQLGRRPRHHTIILALLVVAGLVLIGFVIIWLLHVWRNPDAAIQNPPAAISRYYNPAGGSTQPVNEALFSMELPTGWKKLPADPSNPYNPLRFQSAQGTQQLNIYIDHIPTTLAVNRVLAVQAQGNSIGHDTVSDNCTNFLTPSTLQLPQVQASKVAEAMWQGVEFYCDIGNYERNVTGTSSPEGINTLSLGGPTVGTHRLFFTFTDNEITPQYTVFYGILDSFTLK